MVILRRTAEGPLQVLPVNVSTSSTQKLGPKFLGPLPRRGSRDFLYDNAHQVPLNRATIRV